MKVDYILIDFNENFYGDYESFYDQNVVLFKIFIVSNKYKICFHDIYVECEIDYDYDEPPINKVDVDYLKNIYKIFTEEKYAILQYKNKDLGSFADFKLNLFRDDKIVFHEKYLEWIKD